MPTPNTPTDPFSLLGLEPDFSLSRAQIEAAYLRKAAANHPDLAASSDTQAQLASSNLNHAKQTLLDHESRANALLALLGGPSKSDQKSLPEGFLMEIMQTRQQVEADIAQGVNREKWEQWAQSWRDGVIQRVADLFQASHNDPNALITIRTQLNAWRYIERLIEQLDPDYDPARADFA